ncbi:hypothetical protein [Photobacterium iliopiscarium]|nr:hypothetical protein [Photobacterium iliopiscarium]MCD9489012.1 hypothetical protein [Photobacterium iliopiscarium]MCF2245703.1 hypothetical protein [Photobacterium iliopiscarium]
MTQDHQYNPPSSSSISHVSFSNAVCTVMAFSSASYFSFRFSNGSL